MKIFEYEKIWKFFYMYLYCIYFDCSYYNSLFLGNCLIKFCVLIWKNCVGCRIVYYLVIWVELNRWICW